MSVGGVSGVGGDVTQQSVLAERCRLTVEDQVTQLSPQLGQFRQQQLHLPGCALLLPAAADATQLRRCR